MTDNGRVNFKVFHQWEAEVQRLLINVGFSVDDFDSEAWREYFDNGYLPKDAVYEDLSSH